MLEIDAQLSSQFTLMDTTGFIQTSDSFQYVNLPKLNNTATYPTLDIYMLLN